jgi:hypothetical protein
MLHEKIKCLTKSGRCVQHVMLWNDYISILIFHITAWTVSWSNVTYCTVQTSYSFIGTVYFYYVQYFPGKSWTSTWHTAQNITGIFLGGVLRHFYMCSTVYSWSERLQDPLFKHHRDFFFGGGGSVFVEEYTV